MIRRAVSRPISTLIGAFTLVVLGLVSLLRLPVSLLPALERPRLDVTVSVAGRSREEVLDRFTRPLERRLAAISGVTSVRTTTGDGFVRARVESEWQTDADRLRIETERRLADLDPEGEATLAVEMTAGDPEPIVEVAVLGGASGAARTDFAKKLLVPELARIEGAGRVETVGLTPRHAVVYPQAAALTARGLTAADLVARLRTVGIDAAAGRARSGASVRPLLVREEATSLDALRALRIPGPRGESVLGDVARIEFEEVQDGTFFRLGGQDGALVRVFRAPEANAVALSAAVRARTADLSARASSGLKLAVVDDRSREVLGALGELGLGALFGLLLGTAVLRLILGSWRPTLGLAVVVPASLLTAFVGFSLWGAALDVVSLAGLALAAGMLVDSSIVVLEAIETARSQGSPEPALAGARQIALPVIASFCTTAVVFLPLIYLRGLARAFFGVQAFAIVTSLAASLLFSLTVTPVLAGNRGERGGLGGKTGRSVGRGAYLRFLDLVLARPLPVVVAALAVTALALVAFTRLPRELVPEAVSADLVVRWRLAPDLTPEAARRLGLAVEEQAARAVGIAGRAKPEQTALQLPPPEPGEDRDETGRLVLAFPDVASAASARPRLRAALARLPDVETWIEPRPSAFVDAIQSAGRRLEVVATAADPARAEALAARAARALGATSQERKRAGQGDRPLAAVLLSWDLPRLAALGLDRAVVESQVRQSLGDQIAGRLHLEGTEPEILVRAVEPADPRLLPVNIPGVSTGPGEPGVSGSSGGVVPLGALARLVPGARPPYLERQDGRPAARRAFEAVHGDPEVALARMTSASKRGAGEEIALAGQALELRRAFGQLRLALLLSFALVFLTVAALYESFRIPLVVMVTVPVALGGALGLLLLAGQSLNILSFLGLILLGGIVANNAIVLVHRIEENRRAAPADGSPDSPNESPKERITAAIRRAAAERYRPIVMTTICTLAGMLPLAALGGAGVELRRSLALAVMGGTLTSVFASLLLVPVLYRALARKEPRAGGLRGGASAAPTTFDGAGG
ncbi:MAG TPA: efflux RND transporter permease subunit [Thermoanaerobaculia bacterium]|jgi:multidrug efflux pump subunit AcrB|nr:efflux RND transporter permease subunit [Thermoanaerobaculia bacterium]